MIDLPQDIVDKFLELGTSVSAVNEIINCDISGITNGNFTSIKRFLVELKCQVDRWGFVTSAWLVHPEMMKFIAFSLGNDLSNDNGIYSVWGTKFLVSKTMPVNTIIGLASLTTLAELMEEYDDARYLAIGKLDFYALERMNKLKAFW